MRHCGMATGTSPWHKSGVLISSWNERAQPCSAFPRPFFGEVSSKGWLPKADTSGNSFAAACHSNDRVFANARRSDPRLPFQSLLKVLLGFDHTGSILPINLFTITELLPDSCQPNIGELLVLFPIFAGRAADIGFEYPRKMTGGGKAQI